MDSELALPHRHTYEEDPHSTVLHTVLEGEDEHHEKQSVLKKVQAKAKKLKDALGSKKRGHGHEHDHDHNDREIVVEDDDEEEFEQVPDAHGSPMSQIVLNPPEKKSEQYSGGGLGPTSELPPLEKDPQAPKDQFEPSDPGNYQTKVTDPTYAGGKEAGINPLASSLGKMEISNRDHFSSGLPPTETQTTGEHFSAGEQPNQSSYTEKISAATSTIAEKANYAKDVVASKLGYGGSDEVCEGGDASKSETVGEYGRKVAATVSETLAPVYDKVAEAGSAVVSKMQGTATGTGTGTGTGTATENKDVGVSDKGISVKENVGEKLSPSEEDKALLTGTGTGTATENKDVGVSDKGISVKEYVGEKLSPSEEDNTLSEVISEALHASKGEESQMVGQDIVGGGGRKG